MSNQIGLYDRIDNSWNEIQKEIDSLEKNLETIMLSHLKEHKVLQFKSDQNILCNLIKYMNKDKLDYNITKNSNDTIIKIISAN